MKAADRFRWRLRFPVLLLLVLFGSRSGAADWEWREAVLELQPDESHRLRWTSRGTPASNGVTRLRLITSSTWPTGLIPVFEVERDGRYELRRRPMVGRENVSDPLFFALPPSSDADAVLMAGRWQIQATNEHGGRHWTSLELTAEFGRVAGRFEQNTDYRFASITGGEWKPPQLRLDAEYIQDRYELTARGVSNRLSGTWRRQDDSERGTWAAVRRPADPEVPPGEAALPLWEWRHPDGRRRYSIDGDGAVAGWERQKEPVCRVWRP